MAPFLTPYIGGTEAHSVAEGTRTRCVRLCAVLCVVSLDSCCRPLHHALHL